MIYYLYLADAPDRTTVPIRSFLVTRLNQFNSVSVQSPGVITQAERALHCIL